MEKSLRTAGMTNARAATEEKVLSFMTSRGLQQVPCSSKVVKRGDRGELVVMRLLFEDH